MNKQSAQSEKYEHRYRLLNAAQRLFEREPHRISMCGKIRIDKELPVEVRVNHDEHRAGFGNVATCGNVWGCPVCSGKISQERTAELQTAVSNHKSDGYLVVMMTNTISHTINDSLEDVKKLFSKAWGLFTSGATWSNMMSEYGYRGRTRTIEVTWGENGWHLHAHTLLFLKVSPDYDVNQLEHELKERWLHCVTRKGGIANYENGLTLSKRESDIAQYVAKHGRMPANTTEILAKENEGWTEAHEVGKAVSKNARGKKGRTPFALLQDYAELGDKQAGALFVEYVHAMKNQKQLEWSNGLKADLLSDEYCEKSDDEIVETQEPEVITTIDKQLWRQVIIQKARGTLLAAALDGDQAVTDVLNNVKDGVYHLPSVTDDCMIGNYRVMIGRGKGGWYFALWNWRDKTMRSPDYKSRIGLGSELEARMIASRKVGQLEKQNGTR